MILFAAASAFAGESPGPPSRPRLLIDRDELAAIRVRCGIAGADGRPDAGVRFGSQRDALGRLKDTAHELMAAKSREDDLYTPALLHLVTGAPDRPDEYSRYIVQELLDPDRRALDLDAIIALDWCWDAVEPRDRALIIERLPLSPEPFDAATSPLNELRFHRRLCGLAAAIVLQEADATGPSKAIRLDGVIEAGKKYLEGPFADFVRRRGAMPTSGRHGAWEEADYTLAVELLRSGLGRNLWTELADSLGRATEHYFYADTGHLMLDHGFIHDDGSEFPLRPGQAFRGFGPAVPWVLARHARDPVAIWYANRILPKTGPITLEVDRYGWARLIYGPLPDAEADRRSCPLARNFGGGWLAMRTGWAPGETVLLFDAGQPFWRSRQHYDAGQFQIYRKGRLAVPSGDDVTFEAVPARQGRTLINGRPGDWDHYFQSTIAHNCVTVANRRHPQNLYGRPWPALGNQRLIGHDYDPSADDLAMTGRETGRLRAFETNRFYSYAAADLTPAYPSEVVESVRREILLLNAGAVLVLDRVRATGNRSTQTWHLQLPARPQVFSSNSPATSAPAAGADFKQIHGVDPNAGIWQLRPDQDWLSLTQLEGRLFVRTLLPTDATRRLVGGPGRIRQITAGPWAGRTYSGGDPLGFEYRLWPAAFLDAPSAAYELGRPERLGAQFGIGAAWGRLDVSPTAGTDKAVFLHLLVPTDATVNQPPDFRFDLTDETAGLSLILGTQQIETRLTLADTGGGSVVIRDEAGKTLYQDRLPSEVRPNVEIPRLKTMVP